MKKGRVLLLLLVLIVTVFVVSCTKNIQPQPPAAPTFPANQVNVIDGGVQLMWNMVPGHTYNVVVTKIAASGSRENPKTFTNVSSPFSFKPNDEGMGYGSFSWQVIAVRDGLSSTPAGGNGFNVPEPTPEKELTLELTEMNQSSSRSLPTLYIVRGASNQVSGERSCSPVNINYLGAVVNYVVSSLPDGNRDSPALQLMVQKKGTDVSKRWPNDATEYHLDEDDQYNFGVNNLGVNYETSPGNYYMWVRLASDLTKTSEKQEFVVAYLDAAFEAEIKKYNQDTEYTGNVCGLDPSLGVDLEYRVSVSFDTELISMAKREFEVGQLGVDGTTEESTTATFTTKQHSFVYKVNYATECTKFATLTVDATIVGVKWDDVNKEGTTTNDIPLTFEATKSFVLDLKDPTALVSSLPDQTTPENWKITQATLTFLASDTKCLKEYSEKINFEFLVYKGISNETKNLAFAEATTFKMLEDTKWDNEFTVGATYTATKTSQDAPDTAGAQFEFVGLKNLDLATITATMTVHDCCDDGCTIEPTPCQNCSVGCLTHATAVSQSFVVDNVFFSSMQASAVVFDKSGFVDVDGRDEPTVPSSPTKANVTLTFADANWAPIPNIVWNSISGLEVDVDFDGLTFESTAATSLKPFPCSGFATKTVLTLKATVTSQTDPDDGVEATRTFIATATDLSGNTHNVQFTLWVDTLGPTLTYFKAFKNVGLEYSKIEFAFQETPDSAELLLLDEMMNPFILDFDDAEPIGSPLDHRYRIDTEFTIEEGETWTLRATATDYTGNKQSSELTHVSAETSER